MSLACPNPTPNYVSDCLVAEKHSAHGHSGIELAQLCVQPAPGAAEPAQFHNRSYGAHTPDKSLPVEILLIVAAPHMASASLNGGSSPCNPGWLQS